LELAPHEKVRVGKRTLDEDQIDAEILKLETKIKRLTAAIEPLPVKVPIRTVLAPEKIVKLERERKVIVDTIKLTAYRAESALVRILDPLLARHAEEGRRFLQSVFKGAINILDRFHIMAHFSKAIDEVRAGEARAMQQEGYEPILKRSRWCLLKRPENLTEKQEMKLGELLEYNLKSVRAYLLKEDFQGFWEYVSPAWAGKFMDRWCTRTMRSRLEPMKRVARMLRNHREQILNWFRARGQISAAAVEGLNGKAKVTTIRSYGFRGLGTASVALYHTLGELPEPEFTHRFC